MKASIVETMIDSLRPLYQNTVPKRVRHSIATVRGQLASSNLRWWKAAIKRQFGQHVAQVQLDHGTFLVDLRDLGVGLPTYVSLEYEPKETAFLASTIKPGMVAYDIGANIGIMMGLMSKLTGAGGQVIGFEPDTYNHFLAQQNIQRNGLENTRLFNCALGAAEGTLNVYASSTNFGDHRVYQTDNRAGGHQVAVHRLDTFVTDNELRQPDFIKMDVQGYEIHVLNGMTALLDQPRALTLLTEYWPHGIREAASNPADMKEIMTDLGFESYQIADDTSLQPVNWKTLDESLQTIQGTDNQYTNLVFRKKQ